jgi:hypothetical protein
MGSVRPLRLAREEAKEHRKGGVMVGDREKARSVLVEGTPCPRGMWGMCRGMCTGACGACGACACTWGVCRCM